MKSAISPPPPLTPYETALDRLFQVITWRLPTERVSLDSALGRILRQDIKAAANIPPFDKSAMDGYAVRAKDTEGAGPEKTICLRVTEDLPAGKVAKKRLKKGEAARIMTGAPLPPGADAVVKVEDTESDPHRREVKIFQEVRPWDNTGKTGEDVKKGEVVFKKGRFLGPGEIGMLASIGLSKVLVSRRPRVAVLSSGNEIKAPGRPKKVGQIYDANGFSLTALARHYGAEARFLGIVRDSPAELAAKIKRVGEADVLILSGGVSVGDYDFAADLIRSLGFRELFYKLKIQPGKPTLGGIKGRRLIFGLPGNPVACMVCFELFVRPALDCLTGRDTVGMMKNQARLKHDLTVRPGRRKFLRGRLISEGTELWVEMFRDQKSGVLRSIVESDTLVDVPGEADRLAAGTVVDIWTPAWRK